MCAALYAVRAASPAASLGSTTSVGTISGSVPLAARPISPAIWNPRVPAWLHGVPS